MEMNDFSLNIDGDVYVFDIEGILDFINVSKNRDITEKEITDTYTFNDTNDSKTLKDKTVKEVITPMDKDIDNIRYDLVKTMIMLILGSEEGYYEMPFGVKMAFDSLSNIGLIKKL